MGLQFGKIWSLLTGTYRCLAQYQFSSHHVKSLSVLGSIGCLVLRSVINYHVPLSARLQLPERIQDMSRNVMHAWRWSHCKIVFGQLLSTLLHHKQQVLFGLSILLRQTSHHAIHVIPRVIVHCDNIMQCDCMHHRHPQGPIAEWPLYYYDILHNCAFILSCELWLVICGSWIVMPLMCEFPKLVGPLE